MSVIDDVYQYILVSLYQDRIPNSLKSFNHQRLRRARKFVYRIAEFAQRMQHHAGALLVHNLQSLKDLIMWGTRIKSERSQKSMGNVVQLGIAVRPFLLW